MKFTFELYKNYYLFVLHMCAVVFLWNGVTVILTHQFHWHTIAALYFVNFMWHRVYTTEILHVLVCLEYGTLFNEMPVLSDAQTTRATWNSDKSSLVGLPCALICPCTKEYYGQCKSFIYTCCANVKGFSQVFLICTCILYASTVLTTYSHEVYSYVSIHTL